MCLAIPGQIIKIEKGKAKIKYPTVTNYALIADEKVKVGDWVMVQMGIVVKILSKTEAKQVLKAWQDKK